MKKLLAVIVLWLLFFSSATAEKITITLYFPDQDLSGFVREKRPLELENDKQLERVVLEQIALGPRGNGEAVMYKYFEPISVEVKRIVYLNFPRKFYRENTFGTTGELFLVGSIVNSLLDLPGVDGVQFLVDGRREEAVFGHIDTEEPFLKKIYY